MDHPNNVLNKIRCHKTRLAVSMQILEDTISEVKEIIIRDTHQRKVMTETVNNLSPWEKAVILKRIEEIKPLLNRLGDEEREVRLSSALSILEIGTNKDEIIKAIPELIAGLNEGDWYICTLCIKALCELNWVVLPYIENALSEKTVENNRGERISLSEKATESLRGMVGKLKDRNG